MRSVQFSVAVNQAEGLCDRSTPLYTEAKALSPYPKALWESQRPDFSTSHAAGGCSSLLCLDL
jgi:hypothetical protein